MKLSFRKLKGLFLANLYISTCTFGGGFVITAFMRKKFVDEYHWLDDDEMLDLITIAQTCPGSIAVNAAIMVGYRIQGLTGVVAAVLGTIIPPILIMAVIYAFYQKMANDPYVLTFLNGVMIAVAVIILDTIIGLIGKMNAEKDLFAWGMLLGGLILTFIFKLDMITLILIALPCALLYAFYRLYHLRRSA